MLQLLLFSMYRLIYEFYFETSMRQKLLGQMEVQHKVDVKPIVGNEWVRPVKVDNKCSTERKCAKIEHFLLAKINDFE